MLLYLASLVPLNINKLRKGVMWFRFLKILTLLYAFQLSCEGYKKILRIFVRRRRTKFRALGTNLSVLRTRFCPCSKWRPRRRQNGTRTFPRCKTSCKRCERNSSGGGKMPRITKKRSSACRPASRSGVSSARSSTSSRPLAWEVRGEGCPGAAPREHPAPSLGSHLSPSLLFVCFFVVIYYVCIYTHMCVYICVSRLIVLQNLFLIVN